MSKLTDEASRLSWWATFFAGASTGAITTVVVQKIVVWLFS